MSQILLVWKADFRHFFGNILGLDAYFLKSILSHDSRFLGAPPKKTGKISDYRVQGIQIDRLGLTVSMQKSVLKNMHRVQRYYQKSVLNRPSKLKQQNLTHFGRYLGTRCIFFKTDFCIETVSPSRSI